MGVHHIHPRRIEERRPPHPRHVERLIDRYPRVKPRAHVGTFPREVEREHRHQPPLRPQRIRQGDGQHLAPADMKAQKRDQHVPRLPGCRHQRGRVEDLGKGPQTRLHPAAVILRGDLLQEPRPRLGRRAPQAHDLLQNPQVFFVIEPLPETARRRVPVMLAEMRDSVGHEGDLPRPRQVQIQKPVATDAEAPRAVPNGARQALAAEDAAADIRDHVAHAQRARDPLCRRPRQGRVPDAGLGRLAIGVKPVARAAIAIGELDAPEGDGDRFVDKGRHDAGKEIAVGEIVAFADPDQIARGKRYPLFPLGEHIARVAVVEDQPRLDPQPRNLGRDHRAAVIGRTIVKDDQLKLGISLIGDRLQALWQIGRVVVVRHDDRHPRAEAGRAQVGIGYRLAPLGPAVAGVMHQRVLPRRLQVGVPVEVEARRKPRRRVMAQLPAQHQVMQRRVDPAGCVPRGIEGGIDQRRDRRQIGWVVGIPIRGRGDGRAGLPPFGAAMQDPVQEGVDPPRRDIGVGVQIEPRVEPRGGVTPLAPAQDQIMQQRRHAVMVQIGVRPAIEGIVEGRRDARDLHRRQPQRVARIGRRPRPCGGVARDPPFGAAMQHPVDKGVFKPSGDIGVGPDVEPRAEVAAGIAPFAPADGHEMHERVGPPRHHIGVTGQIEGIVEGRAQGGQAARGHAGQFRRNRRQAQPPPGCHPMGEGMARRRGMGRGVMPGVEIGPWIAPLAPAKAQVMQQRVIPACRDIRILAQVIPGVEGGAQRGQVRRVNPVDPGRNGITPHGPAPAHPMQEGVFGQHVLRGGIKPRVEIRPRVAPFDAALRKVMHQRVEPRRHHVRVLAQVIGRVEGRSQRGKRWQRIPGQGRRERGLRLGEPLRGHCAAACRVRPKTICVRNRNCRSVICCGVR